MMLGEHAYTLAVFQKSAHTAEPPCSVTTFQSDVSSRRSFDDHHPAHSWLHVVTTDAEIGKSKEGFQ
jgi:hypothetical protein